MLVSLVSVSFFFFFFSSRRRHTRLQGDWSSDVCSSDLYLVTSVVGGRVEAVAGFRWSARERDFIPVELGVGGWLWHERVLFAAGRLWERVGIGALFGKKS